MTTSLPTAATEIPSFSNEMRVEADAILRRYVLIAAGFGLIPSPLLDSVAVAALEIKLIDDLARAYRMPFPSRLAAAKVAISIVASIGPIYLADRSKSAFKAVPLFGHLLSASLFSITNAASVYAVGKVFQLHFESGGVMISRENPHLRKLYRREREKGRVVAAEWTAS